VRSSVQVQLKGRNILSLSFISLFDAFFLPNRKHQLSSSASHWLFGKQKNTILRLHASAIVWSAKRRSRIPVTASYWLPGREAEQIVCNHNRITKM
jgi:hypothetical protein